MEINFNEKHRPSQLDILRILDWRGNKEEGSLLKNLEKGDSGERIVLEYLRTYGQDHWVIIRNHWMKFSGGYESDILVLTGHGNYVFEVKTFDGDFVYKDGDCFLDGELMQNNALSQAKKAFGNFKKICSWLPNSAKVFGALIFAGEHCNVQLQSKVTNIEVVSYSNLKQYILKMSRKDAEHFEEVDYKPLLERLNSYKIENPYLPEPIQQEKMKKLKKGIHCDRCKSFHVVISKLYVSCSCGYRETREQATLRTICEYGALNYDKNLHIRPLLEFFNGKTSHYYLYTILKKHFTLVKRGKSSYYLNNTSPLSLISDETHLET